MNPDQTVATIYAVASAVSDLCLERHADPITTERVLRYAGQVLARAGSHADALAVAQSALDSAGFPEPQGPPAPHLPMKRAHPQKRCHSCPRFIPNNSRSPFCPPCLKIAKLRAQGLDISHDPNATNPSAIPPSLINRWFNLAGRL